LDGNTVTAGHGDDSLIVGQHQVSQQPEGTPVDLVGFQRANEAVLPLTEN